MTMRDARNGQVYDVEFDGKRLKLSLPDEHGDEVEISLLKSDLLELLGVKP